MLKCACNSTFLKEAAETIWCLVNAMIEVHFVSECETDFRVVFRHYFSGDEKVSRLLATSSE